MLTHSRSRQGLSLATGNIVDSSLFGPDEPLFYLRIDQHLLVSRHLNPGQELHALRFRHFLSRIRDT